jgi:hypothetical protein
MVLEQLSKLMGKPKATIVNDLLIETLPALHTMVHALNVVHSQPQVALELVNDMASRAASSLGQAQLLLPQVRNRPGPKKK